MLREPKRGVTKPNLEYISNISVHEALNKQECKLFLDIDCKRTESPYFWNMSL